MDSFYTIVVIIAIIILIIVLTSIGLLVQSQNKLTVYPPIQNACPDYWKIIPIDGSSAVKCKAPSQTGANVGNLYSASATGSGTNLSRTIGYIPADNAVNFSDNGWSSGGSKPICAQQKWAMLNNVVWDGVSNYNACK
jgi:hypothetical protein